MAYVDQTKKAKIAAALKQVMPQGWKYTLAVRHHSTIVLTITAAPFDILRAMRSTPNFNAAKATHSKVNHYHLASEFEDECCAEAFAAIVGALNTDNHDRSDVQSDYFDVGHYLDVRVGRWDKPFTVTKAQ